MLNPTNLMTVNQEAIQNHAPKVLKIICSPDCPVETCIKEGKRCPYEIVVEVEEK